jgi:uncharacterized membrane protein YccC
MTQNWAEQLIWHAEFYDGLRTHIGIGLPTLAADLRDAAAEIERLIEELQDCQSRARVQRYELRAEIERLRVALGQAADRLEKLAWEIPAPNEWTPNLVWLANAMRSEIAPRADQHQILAAGDE